MGCGGASDCQRCGGLDPAQKLGELSSAEVDSLCRTNEDFLGHGEITCVGNGWRGVDSVDCARYEWRNCTDLTVGELAACLDEVGAAFRDHCGSLGDEDDGVSIVSCFNDIQLGCPAVEAADAGS